MKATFQPRYGQSRKLNMASMIDVVFLLLIFFMVTASFDVDETKLESDLSQPSTSGAPAEHEPIRVYISRESGVIEIHCDNIVCKSIESLAPVLRQQRMLADVPVFVEGHETADFETMVRALSLARRIGFSKVAFGLRLQ